MEVKPGYKQTEVGVIPEDWSPIPLHLLTTEIGDGIHATPIYSSSEEYYFINGNNLRDGRIIITGETKAIDYSEFKKYRKDLGNRSILMSINGTIGNLGLFSGEAVILGKSAAYLNVNRDVSKMFVYYSLQIEQVRRQFFDGLTGTTIRNLGLETIRKTQIPLPPTKAEQSAIAAALSDVDALIAALDRLIAKKRDIKQAAMQELLTGKRRLPGFSGELSSVRLGELGSFSKGRGITKDDVIASGLPCVRYGEIYTHYHDYIREFHSFISEDIANESQQIKNGDLLFAGSGETAEEIGKCVAYLGDNEAYAGGDIVIFSPKMQDSKYLGYLMNHSSIVIQKAKMGQGDAVVHIGAKSLAELRLKLPQLAEQTAIASVLSDMDAEIAALEARREKTRALKQGMMQELLTGRIRLA